MVSMDFITAVGVLLMTFLYAAYTISSIMTPYAGFHSKELYPAADRTSSLLIEDPGYWETESNMGTDWQSVWAINQTYIKKIGFQSDDFNKSIYSRKLLFMESHLDIVENVFWWEYPTNSTNSTDFNNLSSKMGLDRYNFYLQIRPLDDSTYNVTRADAAARNKVGDIGEVAAVTRMTMIKQTTYGRFDGFYLFGHEQPTKILITIEPSEFDVIENGIGFTIFNWTGDGDIQNLVVGDIINSNYEITSSGGYSSGALGNNGDYYDIYINGTDITGTGDPIPINKSDIVTFFIPISTIEHFIPGWDTSGRNVYIMINVKGDIEVRELGETYYADTENKVFYPVQSTLWVW